MVAHYGYDSWDSDSGLPQNSVETILQTLDGYLWVGTEEGLVRFDGVHFEVFDTRNTNVLGDDFIQALCQTRDGALWIGTLNGLARYRNGRFERMSFGDTFESRAVNAIHEAEDGSLWIGSRDGLSRWKGNTLTRFWHAGDMTYPIRAIAELPGGEIWAGGRETLLRWRDGQLTRFGAEAGISGTVLAMVPNGAGGLWLGSAQGLFRFDAGQAVAFPLPDAHDRTVRAIYQDRDGTLWIGSLSGLYALRQSRLMRFTTAHGLASDQIISILEDREGSLWLGTTDAGLNRVKHQRIANYTTHDGLADNRTWTVFEDRAGNLWAGTSDGTLSRMKPGDTRFKTVRQFGATILALAEDTRGALWLGTRGSGLYRADGPDAPWKAVPAPKIDNTSLVSSICPSRDGSVWVAYLGGGVVRYDGLEPTELKTLKGTSFEAAFSLFEDRGGDVWLGTFGGGLVRFHDGRMQQRFVEKDGLTHNVVLSITQDSDGVYWLGTRGGLSRFDGRHFATYRQNEGVFHDAVQRALDDAHGYLWLTTNRGVFRVRISDLNALAENPARGVHPVAFPTGNGMKNAECNNAQHGVFKTRDGRLWFATIKGLAMADPAHIEINRVPPQVVVEGVLAGGRKIAPAANVEVPPDRHDVEIRYTALSFRVPGAIRFRYRLEGFDSDWVDAGMRRVAWYTNLPPGKYRFLVAASNEDGLWSEPRSYAAFTILPHVWDRLGFRIAAVAAVILAAFVAHRRRMARVKQRERIRAELVEARLDALRAQLRPHFLFNTFNAILPYIDADPARAKRMILQLAELLRSNLRSQPGQLVTVEEEMSILDQYAAIERTRFGERVRIETHVDPAVRSARVPSFLLQPLVENALKHGAKGVAGPISVSVRVAAEGRRLTLTVKDNGRGLPDGADATRGVGLSNVARRLDALYPRQHTFEVGNVPEGGCRAFISIPLVIESGRRERETPEQGVRRVSA
jgi:ligand-binding sensor domain-containing protein